MRFPPHKFLRGTITLQLHRGGMALFHCNTHNDNLVDINYSLCVINSQATSYHIGLHAGGFNKS